MRCVYSLLKYVPDPASGEAVNIGAIVGSEEAYDWRLQVVENYKRATSIDFNESFSSALGYLVRITQDLAAYEASIDTGSPADIDINERWLDRLSRDSRNVLQLSRPTPMSCGSVDEAIELVFTTLIVSPDRREPQYVTKREAFSSLRRMYLTNGLVLGRHLFPRTMISGAAFQQQFDFVVANGRALQLCQTWSFRRADQDQLGRDFQSWAWSVSKIRQVGAEAQVNGDRRLDVSSTTDIEVVYVPPDDRDSPVFKEALSALIDLRIGSVELVNSSSVAERARRLLVDAGVQLDLR